MENRQPEALARWEQRLLEIIDAQWDRFVDPADAVFDDDGLRWGLLGVTPGTGLGAGLAFATEAQLREIRGQCRVLAVSNEFAINGHENRINYIVGTGHSYQAIARSADCPAELVRQSQALLDAFLRENRWHKRQQEIVRRKDRDGECFLRYFDAPDGSVRIRFVEPEQVTTPPEAVDDRAASFGILTDAADVETVRGYFVDGTLVAAEEIQHRKENVDANVKRGLPLFFPVRKNLRRAEKLLRNMSVVAEIQSAIAIIRKHASGTRGGLEQLAHGDADVYAARPGAGRASYFRRYGPGTILDVLGDTDYEFPASGIDAGRYVIVLQAELRAIASRLVMPEFMLTSDASNANYASTMVAEGPAMRMFDRMQQDMIEDDLGVMEHVLQAAVQGGRLPAETEALVEIRAMPPTLAVRDRLQDAQADQILVRNGAMSVQTMGMRHGLAPDHEQQLIAKRADVREHNFNPEEPRDELGRWTTDGFGSTRERGRLVGMGVAFQGGPSGGGDSSEEKRRHDALMQDILKGLAPATPKTTDGSAARADANSAIFGRRTFTTKDGSTHFDAQFAGFDANGRVLLKKDDGTIVAADPNDFCDEDKQFLNDLSKLQSDKGFMAGLKAKPDNIHLDSSGIAGADRRLAWEAQVIRDIGKLSELPSGKATLDGAKQQGKDITIKPRSSGDNRAGGSEVYYDPGNSAGAKAASGNERPPFIGLGQELYNAEGNLSRGNPTMAEREEGGLRAGKQLRIEYNQTIEDPERLKELAQRYPEPGTPAGYPGWGEEKVDERVLGLDGRPLP